MNKLFYGDNLDVLRRDVHDETVDLCYIDPPFNSKRNYNQIYNNIGGEDRAQAQAFIDTWVWDDRANEGLRELLANDRGRFAPQTVDIIKGLHPVLKKGSLFAYLISMTLRLTEIHRALKPTGCFYLHCDPTASHYLKIILDTIFVSQGGEYKNELIWKRTSGLKGINQFGRVHDSILFYSKSNISTWNPPSVAQTSDTAKGHDLMTGDDGRVFRYSDFSGAGAGPPRRFGTIMHTPPTGRHWMFDQPGVDRLWNEGRIVFSRGGRPRLRTALNDLPGVAVHDVWVDIDPINAAAAERLKYPTQKPKSLLERILGASTNEGDTVLDAYCGCGTTVVVAQDMGLHWIGIDITYQSISLVLKRLEDKFGSDVLRSIRVDGIPRDMASAHALAFRQDDRVRKEFEKWAVLTYSNNRAAINDRRGGDGGIDGTGFFLIDQDHNAKIVFQVKSGNVGRGDVAKLNSDRLREGAELAVFLTLHSPTQGMRDEAHAAGIHEHMVMGRSYDRVSIVTIEQMIESNRRLDLPLSQVVLREAHRVPDAEQLALV